MCVLLFSSDPPSFAPCYNSNSFLLVPYHRSTDLSWQENESIRHRCDQCQGRSRQWWFECKGLTSNPSYQQYHRHTGKRKMRMEGERTWRLWYIDKTEVYVLGEGKNMKHCRIFMPTAFRSLASILIDTQQDVSNTGMDDFGIQEICEGLKKNGSVTSLNVARNHFSTKVNIAHSRVLKSHTQPTFTSLTLTFLCLLSVCLILSAAGCTIYWKHARPE